MSDRAPKGPARTEHGTQHDGVYGIEKAAQPVGLGDSIFVPVELLGDKSVGSRIRTFRNQRGWSQAQLGERCMLSQTAISRMESDPKNSRISDLSSVCAALEISIADLVEGVVSTTKPTRRWS